jgi:hypothetical protein
LFHLINLFYFGLFYRPLFLLSKLKGFYTRIFPFFSLKAVTGPLPASYVVDVYNAGLMIPVFVSLAAALYVMWYLSGYAIRGRPGRSAPILRIAAGFCVMLLVFVVTAFIIAFITVVPLKSSSPDMTPLMQLRGASSSIPHPLLYYHDIPGRLVDSLLIAEDPRFFQHRGFDLRNTLYAIRLNRLQRFGAYGGSTLTQQLAKPLPANRAVVFSNCRDLRSCKGRCDHRTVGAL